jgi:hypothetical protein
VTDLREDLDRALRTVPVGEPPVERAKRDGRRIRTRRRLSVVAGALAVAAIAAGYPALTNTAAAPPVPATGGSPTPSATRDPVITAGPGGATTNAPTGLASKTGSIAAGKVGTMAWRVTADPHTAGNPGSTYCYTVNPAPAGVNPSQCGSLPNPQPGELSPRSPVSFTGMGAGGMGLTVGEAASTVTYVIVTFTDTQQLKLIPVTVHGHRYIAWVAPLSMTIESVDAHLGGPYNDSGQLASTIPFDLPGLGPEFGGLWQANGESALPRAAKVIGHGTENGHAWKITAYEGPWGTCFVAPSHDTECVPLQLKTTAVIGSTPGDFAGFGSAAPGVATVLVLLSNSTTVQAKPVLVGNEHLFAFPVGKGVTPVGWTAYDASGKQVGAGGS